MSMAGIRGIHWRRILAAAFLAELAIMAVFFLLLLVAWLAGVPEMARPESTLDYIDAMVSSFVMFFLAARWVGTRLDGHYVLHGILIGVAGAAIFTTLVGTLSGSLAQPPLYLVAHGLKILGGATGGLVARKRTALHHQNVSV